MSEERNKSYRIRTSIDSTRDYCLNVNINQDFDIFEILSLKIRQEDTYQLHNSDYGVIVGRVVANNGFGVPNAKVSIFISADTNSHSDDINYLYPYTNTSVKNDDGIRYNLLPNKKVNDCHKAVGTFPNKTYLLDNGLLMEVFDEYYTLTTRTNESGDYMFCGVPTGNVTVHMDCDLSDCGILSQRPRDMVYKGYSINQFESANEFKSGTALDSLRQILSQDKVVYVNPFWGNDSLGETIGVTRCDIDLSYKFEPTCVFIGSVVGDNASNGISKNCIPSDKMGSMEEMVTGQGRIEMIRKTPGGAIESFSIKGTQLIDGNGTWCYQIPMNLDYVMTDEYGNMVPTDDPSKGIPTRASVRFRMSLLDFDGNSDTYLRAKILVPHNPADISVKPIGTDISVEHEDYDYAFGEDTRDESFRDLLWNNVYTVKQYIPRIQYAVTNRSERFTGIKACNHFGNNNPMPYNSIRIKLPLMFTLLCALIKAYIRIVTIVNKINSWLCSFLRRLSRMNLKSVRPAGATALEMRLVAVADGLCPDLENWYFTPYTGGNITGRVFHDNNDAKHTPMGNNDDPEDDQGDTPANAYDFADSIGQIVDGHPQVNLYNQTLYYIRGQREGDAYDPHSVDKANADDDSDGVCITTKTDYLLSCVEMNLAQEYRVINFDFYNDWVNGVLYFPRWAMAYRPKKKYLFGLVTINAKTKGCMANQGVYHRSRKYVQQCSLRYNNNTDDPNNFYTELVNPPGCHKNTGKERCHERYGRDKVRIFGHNAGLIRQEKTMLNEDVYYYKPCEWTVRYDKDKKFYSGPKVNLLATDLVLLGSLNDCSLFGIPQAFMGLTSSSYKMPTNLALTNMDNNAYVYGNSDGTACTNTEYSTGDTMNTIGVARHEVSYKATETHYSNSTGSDTYISYNPSSDTDDYLDRTGGVTNFHDLFPITEAAGISWNYSGPGQGDVVKEKLYHPGGHFLGLSCVNSQTNIKSCLNLQRICEVGSSMSQRREVVVGYEVDDNNNIRFSYKYFIPTGVISNDDITGASFRSMFATMNAKRLIASAIDENTGYKKYDFLYQSPKGFNGGFSKYASDAIYNQKMDTTSQSQDVAFMKGGDNGYAEDDAYDPEELNSTYAKTTEVANKYYYMFRFGLDGSENGRVIRSKFLLQYGSGDIIKDNKPATYSYMALPQYENSYYFYFGLKDGATAFDRFIGEFYSQCETEEQETSDAYMTVTKTGLDKPANNSVVCNVFNMTMPLTCNVTTGGKIVIADEIVTQGTFSLNGLRIEEGSNATKYNIRVKDANDVVVMANITFSLPDVYSSYINEGFKFGIKNRGYNETDILSRAVESDSGYFDIDKIVEINGINHYIDADLSDGESCNVVFLNQETKDYIVTNPSYPVSIPDIGQNLTDDRFIVSDEDSMKMYLFAADVDYDIYIGYRNNSDTDEVVYMKYDTEHVYGIDNMDILVGNKYLSYTNRNNESFTLKKLYEQSGLWWENIGAMYSSGYKKSMWLLTHYLSDQDGIMTKTFDSNVFCIHKNGNICNDFILFGQPENYDNLFTTDTGLGTNYVFSTKDSNKYYGYALNDTNIYHSTYAADESRACFGKMLIDEKIPLSDWISSASIISHDIDDDGIHTYKINGSLDERYVMLNHGCVIGDGQNVAYAIRTSSDTLRCYKSELSHTNLSLLKIYPLFYYPIINKPFKLDLTYYYWNKSDDDGTNGVVSKCYGDIINGFVDFDRAFGEANWFDTEKYQEMEIPSGEIVSRYDFYDSLSNDKITEFGLTGNTSGSYSEDFISSKFPSPKFSLIEGVPSQISSIEPSILNTPESFEPIYVSGSTNIVFVDKITNSRGLNVGDYAFFKRKRTNDANTDTTGIKYYAIIDENVRLPFDEDRSVVSDINNCQKEYYDAIIEDDSKSTLITDFNVGHKIGGEIKLVIGRMLIETEDGHTISAYKFYPQ